MAAYGSGSDHGGMAAASSLRRGVSSRIIMQCVCMATSTASQRSSNNHGISVISGAHGVALAWRQHQCNVAAWRGISGDLSAQAYQQQP